MLRRIGAGVVTVAARLGAGRRRRRGRSRGTARRSTSRRSASASSMRATARRTSRLSVSAVATRSLSVRIVVERPPVRAHRGGRGAVWRTCGARIRGRQRGLRPLVIGSDHAAGEHQRDQRSAISASASCRGSLARSPATGAARLALRARQQHEEQRNEDRGDEGGGQHAAEHAGPHRAPRAAPRRRSRARAAARPARTRARSSRSGRKRSRAASSAASTGDRPFACSCAANSTIRIAFFAARPISTTQPDLEIDVVAEAAQEHRRQRAEQRRTAPRAATATGSDQRS